MRCRLFVFVSALSLLLCLAVCVLWVRSYGHLSITEFNVRFFNLNLTDANGVVGGSVVRDFRQGQSDFHVRMPLARAWVRMNWVSENGGDLSHNAWGFGFHDAGPTVAPPRGRWTVGGRRMWVIWVPYWLPALLTAALPSAAAYRLIHHRRRRSAGGCSVCGYDLRATPDRCPECGAAAH